MPTLSAGAPGRWLRFLPPVLVKDLGRMHRKAGEGCLAKAAAYAAGDNSSQNVAPKDCRSLQLPRAVARALREDHGPEGRRGEARRAAGHRRALVDEATGGQGGALRQALGEAAVRDVFQCQAPLR